VTADTWKLWDDYTLADHLHYYHGSEYLSRAEREHAEGKYIDVHCWVFTPWHFMHMMGRMVREMGLNDGQPRSRYARPGFDPILNIESSYIWHLSAFRRDRALALGAYTDSGPELCHDWDTSTRFARADAVMVHVPHVLYHWRSHAASTSGCSAQTKSTSSMPSMPYDGPAPNVRDTKLHPENQRVLQGSVCHLDPLVQSQGPNDVSDAMHHAILSERG